MHASFHFTCNQHLQKKDAWHVLVVLQMTCPRQQAQWHGGISCS
jgi:hypothetical protein